MMQMDRKKCKFYGECVKFTEKSKIYRRNVKIYRQICKNYGKCVKKILKQFKFKVK